MSAFHHNQKHRSPLEQTRRDNQCRTNGTHFDRDQNHPLKDLRNRAPTNNEQQLGLITCNLKKWVVRKQYFNPMWTYPNITIN